MYGVFILHCSQDLVEDVLTACQQLPYGWFLVPVQHHVASRALGAVLGMPVHILTSARTVLGLGAMLAQ